MYSIEEVKIYFNKVGTTLPHPQSAYLPLNYGEQYWLLEGNVEIFRKYPCYRCAGLGAHMFHCSFLDNKFGTFDFDIRTGKIINEDDGINLTDLLELIKLQKAMNAVYKQLK